jgi:septation ring formation regulator EzrA
MAEKVTNELIYEVLKHIQDRLERHERILKDLQAGQIRLREELNALRGDDIRREVLQAQMDHPLERIEKRLNLSDA